MPQKKQNSNGKSGNKKPQKGSIFDMVRGIRRGRSGDNRSIHDQIHGIGRKKSGGGFSVAAYMSGGIVLPAHHGNIGHKGGLHRG